MNYDILHPGFKEDKTSNLDVLWLTPEYLKQPRPDWSRTMQSVMVRDHPGKANVFFLPTIDFPSSDENCILSTLTFIAYQGKRYGFIKVVTFDQTLGWKSTKNSTAEGPGISVAKVLVRLDGFYTLMSFVGAVGFLMN